LTRLAGGGGEALFAIRRGGFICEGAGETITQNSNNIYITQIYISEWFDNAVAKTPRRRPLNQVCACLAPWGLPSLEASNGKRRDVHVPSITPPHLPPPPPLPSLPDAAEEFHERVQRLSVPSKLKCCTTASQGLHARSVPSKAQHPYDLAKCPPHASTRPETSLDMREIRPCDTGSQVRGTSVLGTLQHRGCAAYRGAA